MQSRFRKRRVSSVVSALCLSWILAVTGSAQKSQKSPGILLFEKGDFAGAIELLKKSNDVVDLNHLAFAYEKIGKEKDARSAFERSFRSGYEDFSEGIIQRSNFEPKQSVPVDTKLSEYLQANAARIGVTAFSAQRTLNSKGTSSDEWTMRAWMMAEIGRILASNQLVYSAREVDTDAVITAKTRARYTDSARMNNEQGTVVLLVLLDSDGKVKAALPVETLKHGLTEQSYLAAFKMSFAPAQKAGKPVAMLRATTYKFSIY